MNILDENILKDQRDLLLKWGVKIRQISTLGLSVWEVHGEKERNFAWQRG